MALNDTLAIAMSNILNAEKVGKDSCLIHPSSKVIKIVLGMMQDHGYIGSYEVQSEGRGGVLKVNLIGGLNNCGVVKPRFSVTKAEYDKFEKRFLPAKDFGLIIISTSKGIMTLKEAREKGLGGKLLAFVY